MKRDLARKEARKMGLDVEAIPEKGGGDDPFGLIEKTSNNESVLNMTQHTTSSYRKRNKTDIRIGKEDVTRKIK